MLPVILSFMKFCVTQTFWVKRQLDVVLWVFHVVGLNFCFYKTCRYLPEEDSLKKNFVARTFGSSVRAYFNKSFISLHLQRIENSYKAVISFFKNEVR